MLIDTTDTAKSCDRARDSRDTVHVIRLSTLESPAKPHSQSRLQANVCRSRESKKAKNNDNDTKRIV